MTFVTQAKGTTTRAARGRSPRSSASSDATAATATPSTAGAAQRTTQQRITAAALELFDESGYDATTVDAIASRAGVSRRTFFHHFPTKDAVVFHDHVALVARVETHLDEQVSSDAIEAVGGGLALVLRALTADPAVALRRYDLVRRTPELRSTEITWVHRYHVLFSQYLSRRFDDRPHGSLTAEMTAGALVALHNNILRTWLQGGAQGDPGPELDEALVWFRHALTQAEREEGRSRVVVAVFDDDVDPQVVVRAVKDAARR